MIFWYQEIGNIFFFYITSSILWYHLIAFLIIKKSIFWYHKKKIEMILLCQKIGNNFFDITNSILWYH